MTKIWFELTETDKYSLEDYREDLKEIIENVSNGDLIVTTECDIESKEPFGYLTKNPIWGVHCMHWEVEELVTGLSAFGHVKLLVVW